MNAHTLLKSCFVLLLLGAVAACGRSGPLQPPSAAVVETEQGEATEQAEDDKPFVLDGLLN